MTVEPKSTNSEPQDEWLTVAEFAKEMRVQPVTVRSWIAKGQLNAMRSGHRKWLIRRTEIARMHGVRRGQSELEVRWLTLDEFWEKVRSMQMENLPGFDLGVGASGREQSLRPTRCPVFVTHSSDRAGGHVASGGCPKRQDEASLQSESWPGSSRDDDLLRAATRGEPARTARQVGSL